MIIFLIIFALLAGMALPTQFGVNAQLRSVVHSPIIASTISFIVGAIILLIFKIMLNTNNLYLFYELILNPQHFNNNWTASSNSSSGIPAKPKTILGGFSCSFSNE